VARVDLEHPKNSEKHHENRQIKGFCEIKPSENEDVNKQIGRQELVPLLIRVDWTLSRRAVRVDLYNTVNKEGENHAENENTGSQIRESKIQIEIRERVDASEHRADVPEFESHNNEKRNVGTDE
jgi:hypothetical protein